MDNLNDEDIELIEGLMESIESMAGRITQPLDPKLIPLLEVAYSILNEQLKLDKAYSWDAPATEDDRFLNESDIPSVDELNKMLGEDSDS